MTKKILVLDFAFKRYRKELTDYAAQHNLGVVFCGPKTQDEYLKYFENNDIEIIINTWPNAREFGGYTDEMIRKIAASGVKAISHQGAGYDVVGNAALWRENGVTISNCPESPGPDTADTAIFLLLGAIRQFRRSCEALAAGEFRGNVGLTVGPIGKTLGILGMGNIGRMIRDRAVPFGFAKILYHQRRRLDPELEKDSVFVADTDEFLKQCDMVILVAPHSPATHHIINRERMFDVMKEGVCIINVARGPLIDEAALIDALEAGKIGGVGLDVFENEPHVDSRLVNNGRALLLPHIGAFTENAFNSFELEQFRFIKALVEEGKVLSQVN